MRKEELVQPSGTLLRAYYDTRPDEMAKWGPGPWTSEPDKVSWTDAVTKLPCMIVRGPLGALCGYVGVDETHPLHGMNYNHGALNTVEIHGGLTFAHECAPKWETRTDEEHEAMGICHIPEPETSEDVWWFGFDTAHSMDYVPGLEADLRRVTPGRKSFSTPGYHDIYRDANYVASEVHSLARQLDALRGIPRQHHELEAENYDMKAFLRSRGLPTGDDAA